MIKCCRALALAGLGYLVASTVHATDLTLDEAVRRSLERNAIFKAEGAAVAASRYQAELDGLAPPLTIGAELENVAGTGAASRARVSETTLRLGRVFELGGKRSARQAVGAAQLARQLSVVEQRQLDLAANITHRFIQVVEAQAILQLADDGGALANSGRDAVAYRVRQGRSPLADLHLAELAVVRAGLEREDAAHELESARVALSVLWGEQQPDFERAAGHLDALPAIDTLNVLAERLRRNPEQHAFALEANQIDAQRRLAAAGARPDLHTTFGVRHLEAIGDQALVFSLSMPLGSSSRSTYSVRRQQAEQERLAARRDLAALDSYRLLFAHYQELQHARHEVESLRDSMIPLAGKALAETETGYAESRFSFLQVAQVRAVLLGLKRDAIDASARYHRLLADIERATAISGDFEP